MKPHEWLQFAVENAVIIVGLLHIYLELHKRKESQQVRITVWRLDRISDVRKRKNGKK